MILGQAERGLKMLTNLNDVKIYEYDSETDHLYEIDFAELKEKMNQDLVDELIEDLTKIESNLINIAIEKRFRSITVLLNAFPVFYIYKQYSELHFTRDVISTLDFDLIATINKKSVK